MASYLGKISALVTANTGQFRSALNATKQDLNKWRNDVSRTLNSAADGNWDKKILLPIQQIERAIRDANREPLSIGIDESMVSRIRQMARLTEGIAEPLAQAVGQFKALGGAVQVALLPALQRVQNAALEMKDQISEGVAKNEADFARLEAGVNNYTKSLGRAREAQSLLSSMATGKELRFTNPSLVAAMSGASSAQQRASAALTSNAQVEVSAELYAYQRTLAEAAIEIEAHIESERLLGRNTEVLSREQRRLIGELQDTTRILEDQIASQAAQQQAEKDLRDAKEYEAKIRREFASRLLTQITPEEAFADSPRGRAAAADNQQASERMKLDVSAPMAAVVSQFEAMSAASRSVFAPAVREAQVAVDLLAEKIKMGGAEGDRVFRALEEKVNRLSRALSQASEAQSALSSMATGREMALANQPLYRAITSASSSQMAATAGISSAAQAKALGSLYEYQRSLAQAAVEIESQIQASMVLGQSTESLSAKQRELISELEQSTKMLNDRIAEENAQKQAERDLLDAKEYEAKIRREFASRLLNQITPEEAFADSAAGRGQAEREAQQERVRQFVNATRFPIITPEEAFADSAAGRAFQHRLAEPLAQAVGQFKALGGAVQVALLPALQRVQNAALEMKDQISEGVAKNEADFRRLEQQTNRLTQALSRAREASALVSSIPTGREFRFVQPGAAAGLRRTAAFAGNVEEFFGAGDPRTASFMAASNARGRLIEKLSAQREQYEIRGLTTLANNTQRRIDRAVRKQQEEEAALGSQMTMPVDYIGLRQREIAGAEVGPAILTELRPGYLQSLSDRKFQGFIAEQRRQRDEERRALQQADAEAGIGTLTVLPPGYLLRGLQRQERDRQRARMDAAFERVGFGRGTAGIEASLNEQALSGRIAQLRVLQQAISGVSEIARGPAVRAFSLLRDAIADAFEDEALAVDSVQPKLKRLTNDVVQEVARAANISPRRLQVLLQRAGDIGRGGFDKLSLGIQQAVFAVEDFFSVTGGLDQRLRAAGNNISQLGFLMGGLGGLVAGVSVAIGSQLAVALYKYLNNGVSSEDQTRALTAALDEQKRKAEELKSVFDSLADSIAGATLSSGGKAAADRRSGIANAIGAIRASQDANLFALDPGFQSASASLTARERELAQATTPAQAEEAILRVQRAKADVEAAKRAARKRASAPLPGRAQFDAEIARMQAEIRTLQELSNIGMVGSAGFGGGGGGTESDIARIERRIAAMTAERNRLERFQRDNAILVSGGAERVLRFAGAGIDNVNAAMGLVEGVFGGAPSQIRRRLDEASADKQFAIGAIPRAGTQAEVALLEFMVNNANRVQVALLGAAKSMQSFADVSNKVSQSIASDVSSMEQRADKMRRDTLVGVPGAAGVAGIANAQAAEARAIQQRANDALAVARQRVEQQVLGGDNARLGQIEAALQSPNITADTRERLLAERRRIMATRDAAMAADAGVQAALGMQDEASRMAGQAALFDQGRELSMSPSARAARDLNRQLEGVRQFFGQTAEETTGIVDFAGQQEAMRRVFNDAARQAAPMIFNFADEVSTARLQGPSRAALNFTDVATMEGQREFNRLLRRDDPARDVNLSELQKQTAYLSDIAKAARDFGVDVAN